MTEAEGSNVILFSMLKQTNKQKLNNQLQGPADMDFLGANTDIKEAGKADNRYKRPT